jgi:hypothetical protein
MRELIIANRVGAIVELDLAIRIEEMANREAKKEHEHEASLSRLAMLNTMQRSIEPLPSWVLGTQP